MDKVKVVLALLKKHHFWVMTGAVVLLGLIGWFMATSKLWAEYQSNKAKIEGKFKDLNKIKGEERENETWISELEKETKQLKSKVAIAWENVYTDQKDHVLKWPAVLGPDTVARLEALGPNDPIPLPIRKRYQNYIRGEFPELLKIVDARDYRMDDKVSVAKKATGPAVPDHDPAVPNHDPKVIWSADNQKDIDAALDWKDPPESQELREAQEDLWVYQALLTILSKLNDRASGNYNAKVKEIQSLLIGKPAAEEFQSGMAEGRLEKPKVSASAAATAAPAVAVPVAAAPVGRYVNVIPPAGASSEPPGAAPSPDAGAAPAEFKGMPVVMRLIMDQREISRLLVECANSPLPVEVRQFRLRPKGSSAGKRSNLPSSSNSTHEESGPGSYDMAVEVEGIIYIFNPPDRSKVGDVVAAEGAVPAAGVAPANPNGATPPAAAAAPAEPAAARAGEAGAEPEAAAGPADMSESDASPDSK